MRRETQGRRMRKVKMYNEKVSWNQNSSLHHQVQLFCLPPSPCQVLAQSELEIHTKKNLFLLYYFFFFKKNIEVGSREGVAKKERDRDRDN